MDQSMQDLSTIENSKYQQDKKLKWLKSSKNRKARLSDDDYFHYTKQSLQSDTEQISLTQSSLFNNSNFYDSPEKLYQEIKIKKRSQKQQRKQHQKLLISFKSMSLDEKAQFNSLQHYNFDSFVKSKRSKIEVSQGNNDKLSQSQNQVNEVSEQQSSNQGLEYLTELLE
eukprot:403363986